MLSLDVVFEGASAPAPDEAPVLQTLAKKRIWVREVSMSLDGVPCVIARSVTRLPDSRSTWSGIRSLASRPLADLLYNDRTIKRGSFQSSLITRGHGIWMAVRHAGQEKATPLLARRSVFTRHQRPLVVTECFLPAFWDLLRRSDKPSRDPKP